MKSQRRLRLLPFFALLFALVLVLQACGEDADDGVADEPDDDETEEPAEPEPTEEEPDDTADADPDNPFAGQVITFIVPYGPGGGYENDARILEPALEEILGATIAVEYRPGAGSLLAMNQMVGMTPDGMTIGLMNGPGTLSSALAGDAGVQFDPAEDLTYIARIGVNDDVLSTRTDHPLETFEDFRAADEIRLGKAGPGDGPGGDVVAAVTGMNQNVIMGFDGRAELIQATLAGDLDWFANSYEPMLQFYEEGELRPIIITGPSEREETPGIPHILGLDLEPDAMEVAEAFVNVQEAGRLIIGPAGVDPELVSILSDAIGEALARPDVQEQMEQVGRTNNYLPHEEASLHVVDTYRDAPDVLRELLSEAFSG